MTLNITKVAAIAVPASIVVAVAIYFLGMPAWLIVERIERESERSAIEIPESIMSNFPTLREALDKADKSYNPDLPGATSTVASFFDGYGMLQAIKSHDVASSADSGPRMFIENGGKQYSFQVLFQYDAPALA